MSDSESEHSQISKDDFVDPSMKFIDIGGKLGLTGDKLESFVMSRLEAHEKKIQADREREERREQREERKLAAEERKLAVEERKLAAEADERKLKLQLEANEKMLQLQGDLELKKLQLSSSSQDVNQVRGDNVRTGIRPQYPKLPTFKEDKDDIDSFLCRFETHAKANKWSAEEWPTCLSAYLEGSALTLYHQLFSNGTVTYDNLKAQLLIKFQCSKDGFRERFRNAKPETEESFAAYSSRLTHLFQRWLSLSGVQKDFNSLFDFVLAEQFLASLSPDLSVFLRERDCATMKELMAHAEHYRLAHPGKDLSRKNRNSVFASGSAAHSNEGDHYFHGGYGPQTQFSSHGSGEPVNLRYESSVHETPRGNSFGFSPRHRGSRGRGARQVSDDSRRCWGCQGFGHLRRDCPSIPAATVAMLQTSDQTHVPGVGSSGTSSEVLVSSSCGVAAEYPLSLGMVNGKSVSVLRDSGANVAGVRKALVRPGQFLDKVQAVRTFGGRVERFRLALVDVDTPLFKGQLQCCVLNDPVADLIVGTWFSGPLASLSQASIAAVGLFLGKQALVGSQPEAVG